MLKQSGEPDCHAKPAAFHLSGLELFLAFTAFRSPIRRGPRPNVR